LIYHPRVLELHTREQLRAELLKVGAELSSIDERIARGTFRIVKLRAVSLPLARLFYQELVMEGGQVVTAARLDHVGPGTTDVLLCGTHYQLRHLIIRLRWQESDDLRLLADELEQVLDNVEPPAPGALYLGGGEFEWGVRTYVMGILNITPDSFSHDGLIRAGDTPADYVGRAVERALRLVAEGADVLDIGGESTHPSAEPIDASTELARVLPVVDTLAREVKAPLSIDTYKAEVAKAALQAGAQLVNDVWGLSRDPEMKRTVSETGAAVVINHNGLGRRTGAASSDLIGDIILELRAQVQAALEAGVHTERIIIDPGLGFGKPVEQSLELLNRLGEFKSLGLPILIGPSRKGFISRVLEAPEDERGAALDEGTAAVIALGITRGADMIRVHDVKAMTRVARMTDAIVRSKKG
jgi:dihydropteroate synthase